MKLEEKLSEYAKSGRYPFHMPGHKRQYVDGYPKIINACQTMDITEITDFDDLHAPEGVIAELQNDMSAFYGTDATNMLVGGSTSGVLIALSACANIGDEILIARNCHKSVINICMARDLHPHFISGINHGNSGIMGGISACDVDNALISHKNIKAVVIVSPTYEGVVSDIKAIAEAAHKHGIPLIVDEAHGAHFNFSRGCKFGQSAVGIADIVIQSMHKTLPALTQTALIHVKSDFVNMDKFMRFYHTYQTSSPSYILMSDMSACFHYMRSHMDLMDEYFERLLNVRKQLLELKNIRLLTEKNLDRRTDFGLDAGKIVLIPDPAIMTGRELFERLRDDFNIELEMSSPRYCIAMTSLMDTDEGFDRLLTALKTIDAQMDDMYRRDFEVQKEKQEHIPEQVMFPCKAVESKYELLTAEEAMGRISADNLFIYPPGAAFIVAGERFDTETVNRIHEFEASGFEIKGMKDGKVKCVVM